MKNLKIISILLITFFAFSCKKDKPKNTIVNEGLTVYKNTSNSSDGLIATYKDDKQTSTVYIYGASNNVGRGITVKSLVYEKIGNDTLINVILDSVSRPSLMYVSTRAGVKINQLFKFEYVVGDSIKVSFYKYNWLDNTDSLMAQYITKDNNGRVLYGARVNATNDYISEFVATVSAIIFIGVACPIAAGYIVGFGLNGGSLAGALTTLGAALVAWNGTANETTLSTDLPSYPTSPTSVQTPKPIGTPSNPVGTTITTPTIFTLALSAITTTTATCGGNISNNGGSSVTVRGVCWSTSANPTIDNTKTINGTGSGTFTSSITGLFNNTTYHVRAYATNSVGTAYGNDVSFTTKNIISNCGTVTDIDGNVYQTVTIGSQCWMKENLKVTRYRDGSLITTNLNDSLWEITSNGAYAYPDNSISNNYTYGKLYNWFAVNTGKLAPAGWHVPSYAEWVSLVTQLGGESIAGDKMKSTSLWQSSPEIINTDSSGFSALPAGIRAPGFPSGSDGPFFFGIGQNAVFWTSTERYIDAAWVRSLFYLDSGIYAEDDAFKNYGLSVRCVKD